jgi:hypothetical protein
MAHLTVNAKLILKLGHKFAHPSPLVPALARCLTTAHHQYRPRIQRLDPLALPNIDTWLNQCKTRLSSIPQERPSFLSSQIYRGVKDFKAMPVILKLADKNLGLVAMSENVYTELLSSHLQSDTYQQVQSFPHTVLCHQIRLLLQPARHLDPGQRTRMMQFADRQDKPSPFYIIPKLHKAKLGSRPITAQHSYMFAPLSKALARILQTESAKFPAIAKDSKTVIQQLYQQRFPTPGIFLTYDVEALYPNIDITDALKTLHDNLPVMRLNHSFWTKALELIMRNNYVTAEGVVYRQLTGTATGTQVAPPFANLYLYFRYQHVLNQPGVQYQSRFIDDGFMVVDTVPLAERIVGQLNGVTNLKFTASLNQPEAVYLDITIYRGPQFTQHRILDTRVYFKPTNRLLYLPAKSNHPRAHKLGIIKGEAIRCLRNTSREADWLEAMTWIFKGLKSRGYSPAAIKSQFKSIRFADRDRYIMTTSAKRKPTGTTVFTQYNSHVHAWWRYMCTLLPPRLLVTNFPHYDGQDPLRNELRNDWPPKIIYKHFPKISQQVISAHQRCTPMINA